MAQDYILNLDISPFSYAALRSNLAAAPLTARADSFVEALLSGNAKSTRLTIKPIVSASSGLVVEQKTNMIPVDLTKIRSPSHDAAAEYKSAKSAATVPEQLRAGTISFGISSRSAGCAPISFAIFEDLKPLDYLVLRIVTKDEKGNLPDCAGNLKSASNQLTGGLDALRDATLGAEAKSGPLIGDAALYIFDADENNSVAVFVDGRKGVEQSVYGWQMDGSVVDYLRRPRFENLVAKARGDAAKGRAGAYASAANELLTELFVPSQSSGTQSEATKAAAALQDLVHASNSSPTIIVRIASNLAGGVTRSLFAPFGIFGAKGPGAVLDRPIVVVQPLAKERFASGERCIGSWTLALPETLLGVSSDVMDVSHFPDPLPGPRIRDMSGFSSFLKRGDAENASPASGVVVLAHQGEGALWFDADTERIIKQKISGRFSPGSVGILSACSVAATTNRNAELLEKLNEQGFDTLIASPFTLDATCGVKFSYSSSKRSRKHC